MKLTIIDNNQPPSGITLIIIRLCVSETAFINPLAMENFHNDLFKPLRFIEKLFIKLVYKN